MALNTYRGGKLALVAGGQTVTLSVDDHTSLYEITGTGALTGANNFVHSGSPVEGTTIVYEYNASVTLSGGSVNFHGSAMSATQVGKSHVVTARYLGGAWDVDFAPDLSETAILTGDKLVDNTVTFDKVEQIAANTILGNNTGGASNILELSCTAAGYALLDDANAAAQRTTLGLGTIATQSAGAVAITGGSVVGITDITVADGGTGASTASAARTNLGFSDGTYSPTLTNVANVAASTAYDCNYLQVGSTVTVSGRVDIDATAAAATLTQLGISLPVASNFATAQQCAGTGVAPAVSGECSAIYADTVNDRAQVEFLCQDLANRTWYFTFTYRII